MVSLGMVSVCLCAWVLIGLANIVVEWLGASFSNVVQGKGLTSPKMYTNMHGYVSEYITYEKAYVMNGGLEKLLKD